MTQRLFRSRSDRMLAGVAGGLAELWGADPSAVRVIWALLVPFTGGLALIAYVVMAFVVPEEELDLGSPDAAGAHDPGQMNDTTTGANPGSTRSLRRASRRSARDSNGPLVIGVLLVAVGAYFLVREWLPQLDTDWLWPMVLIVVGGFLVAGAIRPSREATPRPADHAQPGAGEPTR